MNKYEFSIVYVSDEAQEEGELLGLLNAAGAEGWEYTGTATDTGRGTEYLMMRRVHV